MSVKGIGKETEKKTGDKERVKCRRRQRQTRKKRRKGAEWWAVMLVHHRGEN